MDDVLEALDHNNLKTQGLSHCSVDVSTQLQSISPAFLGIIYQLYYRKNGDIGLNSSMTMPIRFWVCHQNHLMLI